MRITAYLIWLALLMWTMFSPAIPAADNAARAREYIDAATRGEGLLSWQATYPAPAEVEFRNQIEARKDAMLANRAALQHPVLVTSEQMSLAQKNAQQTEWGRDWVASQRGVADYVVNQPEDYVTSMISTLTPGWGYGFTCPNCVGQKTQIAEGDINVVWNFRQPDTFTCRQCGQRYPDAKYPETATLQAPRLGQIFTFYRNSAEQAQPQNRSGELAWNWVNRPLNVSFSGIIRWKKNYFMLEAAERLAYTFAFTQDARYAERARDILLRYAECYRQWLYHDVWYTYADCDPLYAAFHDQKLPIEWKRNPFSQSYRKDQFDQAAMQDTYFCAGRNYPSTDDIAQLHRLALVYDLTYAARNGTTPIWNDAQRRTVERDLLLEWLIGGEPFVGGPGQATETNNKAPRVYVAQAAVGRVLNLPAYVDTALRGTQAIIDHSFTYDGFSDESPAYTNMFLAEMVNIPELLQDYEWPTTFNARHGRIDMYGPGTPLEQMYRTYLDQLRINGEFFPFSDSEMYAHPYPAVMQVGMRRFPQYYKGLYEFLTQGGRPQEYALFNLTSATLQQKRSFEPPEIYFPGWMTALLRHRAGEQSLDVGLVLNPDGGHRHPDLLSLYVGGPNASYLTDMGYIGDSPMNRWFKETAAHNLVIVDGKSQIPSRKGGREPRLEMMFTSPEASVVEASANAYPEVDRYRRLVCLLKSPEGKSLVVDIFRVRGGSEHTWRFLSEIAASDAPTSSGLNFSGISFPPEVPLPVVGQSQKDEDIYGLRDIRSVPAESASWQAVWQEPQRKFRIWNLTPATEVRAANAPGQTTRSNAGRRIRTLDIVRRAASNLESTFVAVYEPVLGQEPFNLHAVRQLDSSKAGPLALALELETSWGTYQLFNEFDTTTTVGKTEFCGRFGLTLKPSKGQSWMLSCGASALTVNGKGVRGQTSQWATAVEPNGSELRAVSELPAGWPAFDPERKAYLLAHDGLHATGFQIDQLEKNRIVSERFPIPAKVRQITVPALRFMAVQ